MPQAEKYEHGRTYPLIDPLTNTPVTGTWDDDEQDFINITPVKQATGPSLPEPVRTKRDQFLDRIPLGNFLLGPEAIRGYGTTAGMALGGAASGGNPLGALAGGGIGSVLTSSLQGSMPEIFGEPPTRGQFATAGLDLAGAVAGKGVAKALPYIPDAAKIGWQLFSPTGREALAARVLSRFNNSMNPLVRNQEFIPPIAETGFRYSVPNMVNQLRDKFGFRFSLPQLVPSPALNEAQALAKESPEFMANQAKQVLQMGEDLLKASDVKGDLITDAFGKARPASASSYSVVTGKKPNLFQSMDDWINQVIDETKINDLGAKPVESALSMLGELNPFKELVGRIGVDRARITLLKDAFEKSFDRQAGRFKPDILYDYFQKHRAQFNHIAKENEKVFGTKASDLRSAWNRFVFVAGRSSLGSEAASRAIEFQATNAAFGIAAAIPTIGLMNYPVMRGVGMLGKLSIIGPRLGRLMMDDNMVRKVTDLMQMKPTDKAFLPAWKKIATFMKDQGIPFSTAAGTDYFIGADGQPIPAGKTVDNLKNESAGGASMPR